LKESILFVWREGFFKRVAFLCDLCTTNLQILVVARRFWESTALGLWRPPSRPPSLPITLPRAEPGARLSDAPSRVDRRQRPGSRDARRRVGQSSPRLGRGNEVTERMWPRQAATTADETGSTVSSARRPFGCGYAALCLCRFGLGFRSGYDSLCHRDETTKS